MAQAWWSMAREVFRAVLAPSPPLEPPLQEGHAQMSRFLALLSLLLLPAAAHGDGARPRIPADVVRVIDGGTVEIKVTVRLAEVDFPDLKGKCPEEATMARRAKAMMEDFLSEGWVIFTPVGADRSRSRYAGELRRAGEDLRVSQILIGANLARPAGAEPTQWCSE